MLELAVYAAIAVFIISKLYNTLGKGPSIVSEVRVNVIERKEEVDDELERYPQFKSVVNGIIKKDSHFSLKDFVKGAEKAFEMIISTISKNNVQEIESLLNKDIYKQLKREIENRVSKNELHQITIVSITSKEIQMIDFVRSNIKITIKFISEQIKLVKSITTHELIRGDSSVTELVEDIWSFTRNVKSSSRKWLLTAI